jgi:hypothetical protein
LWIPGLRQEAHPGMTSRLIFRQGIGWKAAHAALFLITNESFYVVMAGIVRGPAPRYRLTQGIAAGVCSAHLIPIDNFLENQK